MPSSLDDLRQILVDLWCVISLDRWTELTVQFSGPSEILDCLASETRFRRPGGDLKFITPALRQALHDDRPLDMVVKLDQGVLAEASVAR